jgi:predicted outer membrane repeat protein
MAELTGPTADCRASSFIANIARWGGGMCLRDNSTAEIEHSDFSGNQATLYGGGLAGLDTGQVRS